MIQLSAADKKLLLMIARKTLQDAFQLIEFELSNIDIPDHLSKEGASFVTLTKRGRLRGCIGALTAYQPLVQDVCEHTLAAAFQDPRFPALAKKEEPEVTIEISYLTPPVELQYEGAEDLLLKLDPGKDGVILTDGFRRATYLPQVWEQLPEKTEFLNSLCQKMGAPHSLWRTKPLKVETYQAIHFSEL